MPTYATISDLNTFFSNANTTDWADKDRDGTLSEEETLAVEAGLEASEGIIDGYLQKAGYNAPFDSAAFAALPARLRGLLRQWTLVISGFYLYAWRGFQDRVNPFDALYKHTLSQLQAVAEGLPLAGLVKETQVRFGTGATAGGEDLTYIKGDAWNW
jgi:phage gp36-like protein